MVCISCYYCAIVRVLFEAYGIDCANTEKNKTEVEKYKNELRERIIKGNKYRA